MNPNIPVDKQGIDDVEYVDLHIEAGLVDGGQNEDGEIDWIGTKAQWKEYERLVNNQESYE